MAINKNIPNILTLSRLLLVPVFIVFIFMHSIEARIIFLILFIYASITDFLDGYLARKYDLKSNFGRVFDPIADKALVLVIFVVILVKNFEYSIYISVPILIMILRELLISGIREALAGDNIKIVSSGLGKYKTAVQMVCLGCLILAGKENLFLVITQWLGISLTYLATILSVLSAVYYIKQVYKKLLI
jgi:CDP-diacylglycerol--glycerol-3-phosphate 3-phosphatidyltransferase